MFLESQYFLPSQRYHHWVKTSELVSFVLFILYFKDIPAQSPRFYLQQEIYYHLYLFPCVRNVFFFPLSMLLCYCFSLLIISFKQFDYDMPVSFLCITCAWVSLYFEFQIYSSQHIWTSWHHYSYFLYFPSCHLSFGYSRYIFDHLKTSYCSPVFHYFSLIAFLDNFYCCIFIQLICSDAISNMPLISSSVFFMSGVQFSILIVDLGLFY